MFSFPSPEMILLSLGWSLAIVTAEGTAVYMRDGDESFFIGWDEQWEGSGKGSGNDGVGLLRYLKRT